MKRTTEYWICLDCYLTINGKPPTDISEKRKSEIEQSINNFSENGDIFLTNDMNNYDSTNCECCLDHLSGMRFKILLIEEN